MELGWGLIYMAVATVPARSGCEMQTMRKVEEGGRRGRWRGKLGNFVFELQATIRTGLVVEFLQLLQWGKDRRVVQPRSSMLPKKNRISSAEPAAKARKDRQETRVGVKGMRKER